MIDLDDAVQTPKRAVSDSARLSREAIALVRPFNEQIGAWQAEAARLVAIAQRGRATGRYDAGQAEAIATLIGYIEVQAARFEAAVAEAPEKVAAHSRVADTRTAFAMVVQRLRGALPKL